MEMQDKFHLLVPGAHIVRTAVRVIKLIVAACPLLAERGSLDYAEKARPALSIIYPSA